jgi:hypothetical protein
VRIVRALTPAALEDGRYENGWNGRQILAHLASIEWTYPKLLEIARDAAAGPPATAEPPTRTMQGGNDAYNARQVAKREHLSAAELLAEFERNRAATIAAVTAADEALFARQIRSAGGVTGPLGDVFHAVAVAHVLGHAHDIAGPSASAPVSTTRPVAAGAYRFLPGIAPYSSGVVAAAGYQIVHATLRAPVPWRAGFDLIDHHLRSEGRPRAALCAIALRSPKPFTFSGFAEFNAGYRGVLDAWGLLVDGANPIARTNVAPLVAAPAEPSLYAFAYTVPGGTPRPTFVVAGSGEVVELAAERIVRRGQTSPDAIRDKAAFVMDVMAKRLRGLGADWTEVTAIDVYTPHPIEPFARELLLGAAGPAAIHGLRWYPSRPPIDELEFEMDVRGVARELVL